MREHEKPWRPLSVDEVCLIFAGAGFPWWISGGLAIELAIGKALRSHGDVDVMILRRDHLAVRSILKNWDCWAADAPGSLVHWSDGEPLPARVHDIWCRRSAGDAWRLQLMVDESERDSWVSRRDKRIHLPLSSISRSTLTAIPYVAPHVLLFYKAKNPRAKDVADLEATIEHRVSMDVAWLRKSIALVYGKSHPWLEILDTHIDRLTA